MLKYLIDENVDPTYTHQLRRLSPDLFTIAVGDITAPPKGTLDPEILLWCEDNRCILVTNNRKSMPVHLADRNCPRTPYTGHFYPESKIKYWRKS